MKTPGSIKVLDLFCGIGGFSKGFEMADFNVVAAIDNAPDVEKTFKNNNPNTEFIICDISSDVREFDVEFDIIIGSPPCQGYSHARGNRKAKTRTEKKRNYLPLEFVRWIKELKPKVILMENVYGFLTHRSGIALMVKKKLEDIGYRCVDSILTASDYGVPQRRLRYFCIGILKELNIKPSLPESNGLKNRFKVDQVLHGLPKPIPLGKKIETEVLVSGQNMYMSLLSDKNLKKMENHVAKFPTGEDKKIISCIPQGKAFRSDRQGEKSVGIWTIAEEYKKQHKEELLTEDEKRLLKRVADIRTNSDVKTRKGKWEEGYVPFKFLDEFSIYLIEDLVSRNWLKYENKNTKAVDLTAKAGHRRRFYRISQKEISPTITTQFSSPREIVHPTENRGLSLREGARFQSFPDDFVFYGSFTSISRQIGNAVPPLLAKAIADHIRMNMTQN